MTVLMNHVILPYHKVLNTTMPLTSHLRMLCSGTIILCECRTEWQGGAH